MKIDVSSNICYSSAIFYPKMMVMQSSDVSVAPVECDRVCKFCVLREEYVYV